MKAGELRYCGSWWRGQEFLMTSEETWPTNKVSNKPTENDELKRSTGYQLKSKAEPKGTNGYTHAVEEAHPVFVTTVENDATFAIDPCQYSSWLRLRRVLAWVNRLIDNCHKTQRERNVDKELRSLVSEMDEIKIQGSSAKRSSLALQSTISSTFRRSTRNYYQIGEMSYRRSIGQRRHQRQGDNDSFNRGRGSDELSATDAEPFPSWTDRGSVCSSVSGRNRVQPTEEMAPYTGAGTSLLGNSYRDSARVRNGCSRVATSKLARSC